jgi:3-hydroxyacyl-[acyl-carrier-protein] dehydratase
MDAEPAWISAERRIDAAHPAAHGHFPGNPIVPGAVLLTEILAAIPAETRGIRSAKFLAPVRPGDCLLIRWRAGRAGEIEFEARLADGRLALAGTMPAREGTS